MARFFKLQLGVWIGLTLVAQSSWAGTPGVGTITYSPDVQQAVPTLSGGMLIVLGLLFGVIAYRVIRQKQQGRTIAGIAAVGIMAAGAATGVKLIDDSHAAVMAIPLDIPVGSQATINEGDMAYQNTTNVPQRIRSITYNQNCGPSQSSPTYTPPCTVNLLIQSSGICGLNTECQINQ